MRISIYVLFASMFLYGCNSGFDLSDYEGSYVDVSTKRKDTISFELLENGMLHFTNYKEQKFVFEYNEQIEAIECNFPGFGLYRLQLDESGNYLKSLNDDRIIGVRVSEYDDYLEEQERTVNGLLNEIEPKN